MTDGRPVRDFPFYGDQPPWVSPLGWVTMLAGCGAGFAALVLSGSHASIAAARWIGAVLFVSLPLAGFAIATRGRWTAIFRKPLARDVGVGVACASLTLLASASVGVFVQRADLAASNPVAETIRSLHGVGLIDFFAITGLQLLGEEIITVLPFLATLDTLSRMGWSRLPAVAAAWLLSAVIFGLLHLPTYQWRLLQVLLVIGVARIVLTAAYVITKNVWSSFIAHTLNDWSLFTLILLASRTH